MFNDLMEMGGPVLWVILACGITGFAVFIERSLHLHRARIKSEDFLKGITNILQKGNVDEALTICDETPGPVAYIVKTIVLHRHDSKESIRSAARDAALAETSRMERRLVVVATVAQVAPLLGLLGTALGMVESLLVMRAQAPLVQSADVMDGMIRAMITTAAGLIVAVPSYISFNLLVVKIDRIVLDMERAISEILAFLAGRDDRSGPKETHARHAKG